MKVVIIGGGAGGASCAARLRRLNEQTEIVILEKTNEISIANCGLPYYCGNVIADRDDLMVSSPEHFENVFNINVKLNSEVSKINPASKTVTTLNGEEISYDKLILATGGKPFVPPLDGWGNMPHFTIRHLADADAVKKYITENQPKTASVIGGGFIGVEMAENLIEAGLKVNLIELAPQVLAPLDEDMVGMIHKELKDKGINLYLNTSINAVLPKQFNLASGETLESDMLILALGVRPETKIAADAGIETLATGAIRTNEFMQTNFVDIYACGDNVAVKDFVDGAETTIALAGPANRQGRLIADHICGNPYPYNGSQGSGVVKVFNLTAAFTGNNERQLKKKNIAYKKMLIWGKSHAGYYPNSTPLALKVLYNAEGKILGAQAIGTEGVDKRIDIIATIMRLNGTYKDLRDAELCYAPPYSSAKDPINLIGMAIQNVEENRLKPYFGTDFQDMFVIDVRSPSMHKAGHLPNAINMPIPQLRKHLNEIPHNRPILLHCMIGYNSYLASCILRQNGFDNVFSYAGGFSQYKTQKD